MATTTASVETFDPAEEWADDGVHEKAAEMLRPILTPDMRTLVVGAGQGAFENRLEREGILPKKVVALDLRPDRYRGPRSVTCQQCDLSNVWDFDAGSFDLIIAVEIIEHLANPRRLINEAARILAPGGRLLLSTPNGSSLVQRLRFLFTGEFDYFSDLDFRGSGHQTPLFHWQLERWYRKRFALEAYDSYSFHLRIPLLGRMPMPKSMLWAPNNTYMLKKHASD